MERMGDILARTAVNRARQARHKVSAVPAQGTPAASSATPPAPAAPARVPPAPRAGLRPRTPATRRTPLRALPPRPATPSPHLPQTPRRADLLETPPGAPASANATRVAPADVAELTGTDGGGDRILELPARRVVASAASTSGNGTTQSNRPHAADALSGGMPQTARGTAPRQAPKSARPGPRDATKLREAATTYATENDPAVCPICGGAGYLRVDLPVGDPLFGRPVPCECKERQLEERRRTDLLQISSFQPFNDKIFESFDPAAQGAREAFEVARAYAADPRGWLVLSGPYGVGKTHLAAAIANHHLAQGNTTVFSIVPDLLDHLRAAFAPTSEIPYDALFDSIREAGLVVLDDLGSENSTAWATEKLFQLINHRYNMGYPTVITTNDRLLTHMDERIRSRLSDISLVRHVAIKAQDYRQRHLAGRRGGSNGAGAPASSKAPGASGSGAQR